MTISIALLDMNILQKYKFELIIIFIQLIGPISLIGLIAGSVYVFYKIALNKEIDLVSIFILLIPSIALGYNFVNTESISDLAIANNWIKIKLPAIKTVYLLGPVAISVPFFAALAVPVRLIVFFKNNSNKLLFGIWFLVLLISIIGLLLAIINKQVSAGGLTVGLRIALTIGAILLPLSVTSRKLEPQLMIIVKMSVVFFLLGLLNGLWMFVAFAFPAYLFFSDEKNGWKILGIVSLIVILFFNFSFTLKLTALGSFVLLLFYNKEKLSSIFVRYKIFKYLLYLFPILFMVFLVYSNISGTYIFSERFTSKLFEDRVPLWTYSLDLILNSNFFIVPAARDVKVIDYSKLGEDNWGFGAHNIYLEMARQLGVFATLLITVIIGTVLLKTFELIRKNKNLSKILLSLFAVYIVWGLTGNALVWDGTGFLYWLIIGQLYQSGLNYKRMLKRKRKENNLFRENVISTDNVIMP